MATKVGAGARKEIARIEAGEDSWQVSEPMTEPVMIKRPLDKVLQVRLTEEQWQALRARAHSLGLGPATLMRMWVIEKLKRTAGPQVGSALA